MSNILNFQILYLNIVIKLKKSWTKMLNIINIRLLNCIAKNSIKSKNKF